MPKKDEITIKSFPSKREKYLTDQREKERNEKNNEKREHNATKSVLNGVLNDLEVMTSKYDKLLDKLNKGACFVYFDKEGFIESIQNIADYPASIIRTQDQEIIDNINHPLYNKAKYYKMSGNKIVKDIEKYKKFKGVIS